VGRLGHRQAAEQGARTGSQEGGDRHGALCGLHAARGGHHGGLDDHTQGPELQPSGCAVNRNQFYKFCEFGNSKVVNTEVF